jgi:hypothetical protein
MVLTVHRWFANKSCPGDWLMNRMDELAAKVTAALAPAQVPAEEKPVDKADKSGKADKVYLYNVVVGVYSVKSNAEAHLREVQKEYPGAFIKRTVKSS